MADPALAPGSGAAEADAANGAAARRLARIELPDATPLPSAYAEADRGQAVADLLMENSFDPDGVEGGPSAAGTMRQARQPGRPPRWKPGSGQPFRSSLPGVRSDGPDGPSVP